MRNLQRVDMPRCFLALIAALSLAGMPLPLAAQEITQNPGVDSDWPAYGGAPGGGQYSPLRQINRGNVGQLEQTWIYHTGDVSDGSGGIPPTTFEANPIIAGDALIFCTPFNRVIALDAASGTERWTFDARIDRATSAIGAHICRGVAHWIARDPIPGGACQQRVFEATSDGRLVAIDAATGRRCEDFGSNGEVDLNTLEVDLAGRVGSTSPPAVFRDTVIVGNAIPSNDRSDTPEGVVRAFDAYSGRQLWVFNPVPAEMRQRTGSVNVWAPMSVDEDHALVFLPASSPTPDPYGVDRLATLEYANAIIALDANTGVPVWHFQTVHHDLWDYDLPAQPALVSIAQGEQQREALIQITKTGFTFVLDRLSGKPLFPVRERKVPSTDIAGEQASPTQPIPTMPMPFARQTLTPYEAWGLTPWDRGRCRELIGSLRNEGLYTPPSERGTLMIPNVSGGGNWGGPAYHPQRNYLVVNAMNLAFSTRLERRDQAAESDTQEHGQYEHFGSLEDTPYVWRATPLLSPLGIPCTPPPWGTLTAIDLSSGALAWQIPLGQVVKGPFSSPAAWGGPNVGGPMVTAGDLVFIAATLDRGFQALDLETGERLWREDLPAPGMATPMSYMAAGRQFVVIAAGGHAAVSGDLGDAVVAFSLPAP